MEDLLGEAERMEGLEPSMISMTTVGVFAKDDLRSTHDVFSNTGLRADRGNASIIGATSYRLAEFAFIINNWRR